MLNITNYQKNAIQNYNETDKEVVVYIYIYTHNGILLSHNMEWIWVSSTEVDEPRTCYKEWSKSEKQMSYVNLYIFPSPVDHTLSELSSMTNPSCVALHGMTLVSLK